jgi:hypothetical protein
MERTNKLIAEFMGIEEAYNPNGNDWVLKKTTPDVNGDTDILESCKGNELQYHTSWDRLMPVVQKIEQDCEGVPQYMLNISLYSDINEVYNAVIEFIKNQNN